MSKSRPSHLGKQGKVFSCLICHAGVANPTSARSRNGGTLRFCSLSAESELVNTWKYSIYIWWSWVDPWRSTRTYQLFVYAIASSLLRRLGLSRHAGLLESERMSHIHMSLMNIYVSSFAPYSSGYVTAANKLNPFSLFNRRVSAEAFHAPFDYQTAGGDQWFISLTHEILSHERTRASWILRPSWRLDLIFINYHCHPCNMLNLQSDLYLYSFGVYLIVLYCRLLGDSISS